VVIIEKIDPRDISWEVDQPAYRVYFWHQQVAPVGIPQEHMGYVCDENRLVGATDVREVLDWATSESRPDQTFTLYAEYSHDGERGLVRLVGTDPTLNL
jgi:hypothetical protein